MHLPPPNSVPSGATVADEISQLSATFEPTRLPWWNKNEGKYQCITRHYLLTPCVSVQLLENNCSVLLVTCALTAAIICLHNVLIFCCLLSMCD